MGKGLKGGSFPLAPASSGARATPSPGLSPRTPEIPRMIERLDRSTYLGCKPKAEIDELGNGAYRDKASLVFETGRHVLTAVKTVAYDHIESHRVPVMED